MTPTSYKIVAKYCAKLNRKAAARFIADARALFKSARKNAKGEIVVETHDRIAAINALDAMQPNALAASRSLSLSLNGFTPAARDVHDPDAALRLFKAFGE